jgi:hypothetical protein
MGISAIRVNGLNLTVPEHAKELIKSWDMRENTEKFADSGVDDQVCILTNSAQGNVLNIRHFWFLPFERTISVPRKLIVNVPFTQNVREFHICYGTRY